MIIPSAIAVKDHIGKFAGKISDLDFYIGDEALSPSAANYSVKVSSDLYWKMLSKLF
jgi:hypothetical protein